MLFLEEWGLDNRTNVLYNQSMENKPWDCTCIRNSNIKHRQVFLPYVQATFGVGRTTEQDQFVLLAIELAPIKQSVNGGELTVVNLVSPVNSIKPLGEGHTQRLDNPIIY
jgi:hypothetical protein